MTNEEAIRIATGLRTDFKCKSNTMVDFCNTIIKALEQEDILDKVKTEIKQLRNFRAENYDLEQYCDYFDARIIFRDDVFEIIDKYKLDRDNDKNAQIQASDFFPEERECEERD